MSSCAAYELLTSAYPCVLRLRQIGTTREIVLNLFQAVVYPLYDTTDGSTAVGFTIKTKDGVINANNSSTFTITQIRDLIGGCHAGTGGGGAAPTPIVLQHGRQVLTATWTSPIDLRSLSYHVLAVANPLIPPTVTVNTGTTDLYLSESGSWAVEDINSMGVITFTLSAGDEVIVNYTNG